MKFGPRSPFRIAPLVACGVACLCLTGCVRRTISISSEPAGALCWLNGREIGRTPLSVDFIYYGDYPSFTDCTTNTQSGANMVGLSDLRYDTSQYSGGTFYDTYAHAQALVGTSPIIRVSLVIDSGWQNAPNGDQRLTVSNTTVNDNVYQFVSSAGGGAFRIHFEFQ